MERRNQPAVSRIRLFPGALAIEHEGTANRFDPLEQAIDVTHIGKCLFGAYKPPSRKVFAVNMRHQRSLANEENSRVLKDQ